MAKSFDTILVFKGKGSNGPEFDEIEVYEKGEKHEEGAIDYPKAVMFLENSPFEYHKFLNNEPTGQFALRSVLSNFGFKLPAYKKKALAK